MLMSAVFALLAFTVSGLAWYVHLARQRAASPAWVLLRGVVSAPIRLWTRPPGRHRVQDVTATEAQPSSNQTVLPGEASP
jgi:hypothetical protein